MTAPQEDLTVLTSEISDIGLVPLDEDVAIDLAVSARITRWTFAVEDESGSQVSAFNSSI
jgi:hypothetical protein